MRAYKREGMRYSRVKQNHYLESAGSLLRVGPVMVMDDPTDKARTVRVFEVLQCVRQHQSNPSPPRGSLIAVSFPSEHVNAAEYTWSGNESFQVPFEIKDRKANLDAVRKN